MGETMARGKAITDDVATLQMALVGYELERQKIDEKIKEIQSRIGRRRAPSAAIPEIADAAPRKRILSPAARKRIAMAQQRRWAEHRKKTAAAKTKAPAND